MCSTVASLWRVGDVTLRRCIIHFNLYATVAYPDMHLWGEAGPLGCTVVRAPRRSRDSSAETGLPGSLLDTSLY